MIKGIFHQGSGLGNQLHRYVGTMVIALEKGVPHSMIGQEFFKGNDFMRIDLSNDDTEYRVEYPSGRVMPECIDGVIDGEFQGEQFFIKHLDTVREWLEVEPLEMPDDLCVIGFRGGEYVGVRDLFLPQEYWDKAIAMMREINPNMRFEVHTDDPETARQFFPDFNCIHDIGLNWRSVRYAKHLIIANSSFYILPSLLNESVDKVIAPLYWAGYNKGYWQMTDNDYSRFTYIHHEQG